MSTKQPIDDPKKTKLDELYATAKAKGTISYDEIISTLSSCDIDPDQFDTVLDTLQKMGVTIKKDDELSFQEKQLDIQIEEEDLSVPDGISIDDPVRMYLKDIGRVPLLTAEETARLAAYARSDSRSVASLRLERDALVSLLERNRDKTKEELAGKGQVYRSVGYLTGAAALLLVL